MYECIAKKPDLIILDDPISSFDRNKKYAVIDMLFRGKKSLAGKTVLMMTHDLEPIIDILYVLPHYFSPLPLAAFLEMKDGCLKEIEILRSDILTFGQICEQNMFSHQEDVVKLVYLRRYYEILDNKGLAYQLLSNLFKKRKIPIIITDGTEIPFTPTELSEATVEIKERLPDFNYDLLLTNFTNYNKMKDVYARTTCNYEKLQVFRIMQELARTPESHIINKFINETFHIENEFIMQINPCKYEIIPSYIIDECNRLIDSYSQNTRSSSPRPVAGVQNIYSEG
jgi:hypothetical protein